MTFSQVCFYAAEALEMSGVYLIAIGSFGAQKRKSNATVWSFTVLLDSEEKYRQVNSQEAWDSLKAVLAKSQPKPAEPKAAAKAVKPKPQSLF